METKRLSITSGPTGTSSAPRKASGGRDPMLPASDRRAGRDAWAGLTAFAVLAWLGAITLGAATLTELHAFRINNGGYPTSGLVQDGGGNLYGTTFGGAGGGTIYDYGTVYKIDTNGALTTLVRFTRSNGANPLGGLVLASDGNLYGTTTTGGTQNYGTLFRLTPNGVLTTLVSFAVTNGFDPSAALVQGSDGSLYGSTQSGGAHRGGTIFQMSTQGALTTVASLAAASFSRTSLVQASDGSFYGTTPGNTGTSSYGSVFNVTTNGVLTVLAFSFGPSNGYAPQGGLAFGTDGMLYGTTQSGGAHGFGTVFRVTTNGSFTSLASFNETNGAGPMAAPVLGLDGFFYGTTLGGGVSGNGTIYRMTTNGVLTNLASFNGTNGTWPRTSLMQSRDGTFYGTTLRGGDYNGGTVFRVTTNGTLTTLISFAGATIPSSMVQDTNANFYGTTAGGGDYDYGSVFRMSADGAFFTLVSFNQTNGANPYSSLLRGDDGCFYGATYSGGYANSFGTLFKMTPDGALTSSNFFTPLNFVRGESPMAGLARSSLGPNFYGVTRNGGTSSPFGGSIFAIDTNFNQVDGPLTFDTNNTFSAGTMVQAADGSFYGTTEFGGIGPLGTTLSGNGTIFRATPSQPLTTTLVQFNGTNGANPYAGLTFGSDGNLYGTTLGGGTNLCGTIFQLTTNGALTSLFSFNGTNGASPYGGLCQGRDGDFYGTTFLGGSNNLGTVFRITPDGNLTTLHSFGVILNGSGVPTDGAFPGTSLVQGLDGDFYGTTTAGGSQDGGNIFRLSLRPTLQALAQTNGMIALTWDATPGLTYQLQTAPDPDAPVWSNLGPPVTAKDATLTATDTPGPDEEGFYRVLLRP